MSTSSAFPAPFAEVSEEAEQAAVRPFLSARSPEGDGDGTSPPAASQNGGTASASSYVPAAFTEISQDADQSAVRSLAAGTASSDPALSGTGYSYRHHWGARRGQWTLRLNLPGATARSRVFVAIGEGAGGGTDAGKFIGAARFTLHNVAPRAGGVDIWVNIEWSTDILIYVDYLVVNP